MNSGSTPMQDHLAQLLYGHQQESNGASGLEDFCDCGQPLHGEHIARHQASVVIAAIPFIAGYSVSPHWCNPGCPDGCEEQADFDR